MNHFYEFGPFRIDVDKRLVLRDDEQVQLGSKVFDTLLALVENCGQVLEKDELMKRIWPDTVVEENNLAQNIFVLRKVLGERPDEHRYIVTIPGRGYRFVASVTQLKEEETPVPHVLGPERTQEEKRPEVRKTEKRGLSQTHRRWGYTTLVVIAVFGVTVVLLSFRPLSNSTAPDGVVRSLAVLPFRSLDAGASDEYIEIGLADALITRLSNLKQLSVRPTTSIRKYASSETDVLSAGRELKVDSVLDGKIQRSGDGIRITVQLVRVEDGRSLWADTFDEKFTDIFKVQDLISAQVARALALELTGEEQHLLSRRFTNSTEAYMAYLKGRYFWNKRTETGLRKSIEYYRQASDFDPEYALPDAGLADSYVLLGFYNYLPPQEAWPNAKIAATRALEIDRTLAEAHASLALVKDDYELDWHGAEAGYKRAIELNPSYATVRQWYAWHLLGLGRREEALAQLRQAQELDPLSLSINTAIATFAYFTREYDRAIELALKTLDMDPTFVRAHLTLGLAYEQKGLYAEAIAEFQKARELSDGSTETLGALGHVYAVSGRRVAAQRVLDELIEASRKSYVPSYDAAVIHAGLANDGKALEWIEQGYSDRSLWWGRLKLDPRLDRLRSNQRFQKLLEQIERKR